MIRGIIVVLAMLAAGCLKNAAFPCSQESDCLRGGEQGVCEATTGFCSFADSSCPDGRRYGDLSGSFANKCVGDVTPVDGPQTDMPVTGDMVIDDPPAAPFCDAANEPALVGCWEFENVLTDASGDNNNGTVALGAVSFVTGKVGKGLQQDANSHVTLADTASLSPTSLTIEAFINPSALPAGAARMGVLDNNNQYGLFIHAADVQCTCSVVVTAAVTLPTNVFSHVACTFDAATGVGRVYIDGVEQAMTPGGTPLTTGDASGGVIGGNSPGAPNDTLVGIIDQLRVWSVARSAAEVCAATGKTTCP